MGSPSNPVTSRSINETPRGQTGLDFGGWVWTAPHPAGGPSTTENRVVEHSPRGSKRLVPMAGPRVALCSALTLLSMTPTPLWADSVSWTTEVGRVYAEYPSFFWIASAVVAALLALITGLLFNIARHKTIEQQWLKAYSELEARVEERTATLTTEIFERKRVEEEFRKLATTDPLTGTYNRRHVLALSEREFARARRYQTTLSVLMLDADHFKEINDTWGHDVGDDVLRSLTVLCEAHLRTSDVFGRLGGEEFILTLPETDKTAAAAVAERLRHGVESNTIPVNGEEIAFTVSIGVSELCEDDASFADILKRADQAVYTAKRNGRNQIEAA